MSDWRTLATVVGLWACIGCGSSSGSGSSYEIAAGPLAGRIGGQPWTIATAETDAFLSDASGFFVVMYGNSFTACSGTSAGGDEVLMNDVPTVPGDYDLSLSLNATFYVAATNINHVATRGRLVVDTVTPTIMGGAHIVLDADNEVSGRFDITICPP